MKAISMKAPAMPKIAGIGVKVMNLYIANRLRVCIISGAISYFGLLLDSQLALFAGAGAAILSTCPVKEKGGEK
ncbi:MAG: hypothetical protein K2M45_08275 [Muribaculaceae bacterium]|nr:hypothetical protein [Muribaculaceae bacterium]